MCPPKGAPHFSEAPGAAPPLAGHGLRELTDCPPPTGRSEQVRAHLHNWGAALAGWREEEELFAPGAGRTGSSGGGRLFAFCLCCSCGCYGMVVMGWLWAWLFCLLLQAGSPQAAALGTPRPRLIAQASSSPGGEGMLGAVWRPVWRRQRRRWRGAPGTWLGAEGPGQGLNIPHAQSRPPAPHKELSSLQGPQC